MTAPAAATPEFMEVVEGTTRLHVPRSPHVKGPKAKTGQPFYNPAMRLARDLSVLILRAEAEQRGRRLQVCDAMASLGARGLRFAREVPGVQVLLNDVNAGALALARRNAEANELRNVDFRLGRLEKLLVDDRFDWVDVDPFGTPAPFLDFGVHGVEDGGVVAVTATDKATLCGVYPEVCLRRYGARPLHGPLMHETAARILVGALARAAGRRDRWIEPLATHSTQHYVRAYARVHDGAQGANRQAAAFAYAWTRPDLERGMAPEPPPADAWAGPLWGGPLSSPPLLDRLAAGAGPEFARDVHRLVDLLREESTAPPLYYTIDEFTREMRRNAPRMPRLIESIRATGRAAARTHFTPRGFKTDATAHELRGLLQRAPTPVVC